jgi:signal transduction histidine kinase
MHNYLTLLLNICVGVCLLWTDPTYAREPYTSVQSDPLLEPWRWRRFPELHGRGLQCLEETKDGAMWFGVDNGVVRYDGLEWTTYTENDGIYGSSVVDLLRTGDGSLYAATKRGISRFSDGSWSRVFPADDTVPWPINRLSESPTGGILAATDWGALKLLGSSATLYTGQEAAARLRSLAPSVQIVTIESFPRKHWSEGIGVATVGGLTSGMQIWALAPDGPGAEAGLRLGDHIESIDHNDFASEHDLDGSIGTAVRLTIVRESSAAFEVSVIRGQPNGTIPDIRVSDVLADRDGGLWFSTRTQAVLTRPSDHSDWKMIPGPEGPTNARQQVRLVETLDGTIYRCSGRVVSRFDQGSWKQDFRLEWPAESVHMSQDGTLWIGGGWGTLNVKRKGDWTAYPHRRLPTFHTRLVDILESADGSIWFAGLRSDAVRYDQSNKKWQTYPDLWYDATSSDGTEWFHTHSGHRLVSHRDGKWIRYGPEDGLPDDVSGLTITRSGQMWARGSQNGKAAIAQFVNGKWQTTVFPKLSPRVAGIYEANDGTLWVQQSYILNPREGHLGGLIKIRPGQSPEHIPPPSAPLYMYGGMGETAGGALWWGGRGLRRFDGDATVSLSVPEGLSGWVHDVYSDGAGHLWVGTRSEGVFQYDGNHWKRHGVEDGLASNFVRYHGISGTADGNIWVGTQNGLSRFDGQTWLSNVLPLPDGTLTQVTSKGTIWYWAFESKRTMRYRPTLDPPETEMMTWVEEVAQPGNTALKWSGYDPWRGTSTEELTFSWRLDDDPWSHFSHGSQTTLLALEPGKHTFQVRSRDLDFNVDPSPATVTFMVVPPVYRQSWFLGMVIVFVGGIGFQTSRVVRRDRRLREANVAMSDANKELFQVNVDLQREQVLERLRGQAQGMQSSEDIGPVVEAVNHELTRLGVPLITSSIAIYRSEFELERWSTGQDERLVEPVVHLIPQEKIDARKRGEPYHHVRDDDFGQRIRQAVEAGHSISGYDWRTVPEEGWPNHIEEYASFFEGGHVLLRSEELISEDVLAMVKRFGEVFGFAHSRYKELQQKEAQNRRLAVEASVQRLRAEVQSMDEASDFERILSLLTDSLKTVELTFDGCEIDVLDEPVENPTMELFEAKGFRYTNYTIEPSGTVGTESYNLLAPFPRTTRQNVERFNAGEPWQGTSEGEAIVEVPAGSYGRLRLTATDREQFTDDEVATLREFADAVALGYARYLDIREIQEATEKKSAFLASMSHELRTPMNAIKGFTNLVLRRDKSMEEKSRENLEKVDHASDHLLTMINDLLDLSKIEAGRMDVNPEQFNIKELVASCCDTVSPLIQDGVELRQDVSDGEANTDRARVQQMVINLLSNAIKFTDTGSVTVKAERETRPSHEALARPAGGGESGGENLVISVTDTGKGIPADELPTLFDEYRQVEGASESKVQKGTGLGLSITKKFAELLGGVIGVESEVGKGSTFTVRVPVEFSATDA